MWNIIIGFGLIVIGAVIGFSIAAMLMQSKITDEITIASHTYEHLMHEKCRNCEYKNS